MLAKHSDSRVLHADSVGAMQCCNAVACAFLLNQFQVVDVILSRFLGKFAASCLPLRCTAVDIARGAQLRWPNRPVDDDGIEESTPDTNGSAAAAVLARLLRDAHTSGPGIKPGTVPAPSKVLAAARGPGPGSGPPCRRRQRLLCEE